MPWLPFAGPTRARRQRDGRSVSGSTTILATHQVAISPGVGAGIRRTQFGRVKTDPPVGQVWRPAWRPLATWPADGSSRP